MRRGVGVAQGAEKREPGAPTRPSRSEGAQSFGKEYKTEGHEYSRLKADRRHYQENAAAKPETKDAGQADLAG
jgi:hypothetical protein